ncbi:HalOD1 output domain-containing protein [Halovivax sp.]|uniref:HalOD1 output domain-containing protein n=1 Tax=Halovivax sp. TaxID=1935978 RepID=UPI0025B9BB56|nr:HalOD1 output domain-containing protein [Halovivax sp.]
MSEITSSNHSSVARCVRQHDRRSNESLCVTIASAVADVLGTEVTELEPLHYTIDTDALERLFEPRPSGPRTDGVIAFEYQGCTVDVSADGEVVVETARSVAGR